MACMGRQAGGMSVNTVRPKTSPPPTHAPAAAGLAEAAPACSPIPRGTPPELLCIIHVAEGVGIRLRQVAERRRAAAQPAGRGGGGAGGWVGVGVGVGGLPPALASSPLILAGPCTPRSPQHTHTAEQQTRMHACPTPPLGHHRTSPPASPQLPPLRLAGAGAQLVEYVVGALGSLDGHHSRPAPVISGSGKGRLGCVLLPGIDCMWSVVGSAQSHQQTATPTQTAAPSPPPSPPAKSY